MVRSVHPRALTRASLNDLLDHLEDRLRVEGRDLVLRCDGTLLHSRAFLKERGIDVGDAVRWLKDSGGYCDCEVLMNVPHSGWWDLPE